MRRKDREIRDTDEIVRIIERCRVCHLGMSDGGMPYVVPLNFGYTVVDGELTLYFHSAKEGRKLDILRANPKVCFEFAVEGEVREKLTNPCSSGYFFESVIGFGEAETVTDDDEKCLALSLLMKRVSGKDFIFNKKQSDTVCVIKVRSKEYTGKRAVRSEG